MPRPAPRSSVLHIERMELILDTNPDVRQGERKSSEANACWNGPMTDDAAPLARASMEVITDSLRRERRRPGLSLSEVARRAGISKSTLSQLESGAGNPSLETLWALAVTLDVPFSRLVDPPRPRPQLIRAGEGPVVAAADADYRGTLLAACPPRGPRAPPAAPRPPGPPPRPVRHRRRARQPADLRAAPARRDRARHRQR